MKTTRFAVIVFTLFISSEIFFSQSLLAQTVPWVAPKEANEIKNPLHNESQAAIEGKKIYVQLCAVCHGNKGKGDGVAGLSLKPKPGNFTTTIVQEQTDGALFWKLTNGRPPMAPYKDILTETKRWQLVNYIRSFKK